ncbi:MAG: type III polyketide synthase [Cytophagales bacterium]
MSKIISIGTAQPKYRYQQNEILDFMKELYHFSENDSKRLSILYQRSGIVERYSAIEDYKLPLGSRTFYENTLDMEPFPSLEKRMQKYFEAAPELAIKAIENCIATKILPAEITHLITVSCTGMAAPGLDIMLVKQMGLNTDIHRTSVNFMGCYAAVHGLKIAHQIAETDRKANVVVVCIELCSLHFQKENNMENIASNLLFADGAAAVLISSNDSKESGLIINNFYSLLLLEGEADMAWHLSSKGFLMTLSAYIPKLIESGIATLVEKVVTKMGLSKAEIDHWAIHPGGRKILEVAQKELELEQGALDSSFSVLKHFGNMSSPTILYVIKDIWENKMKVNEEKMLGIAFGPGLTMETVLLSSSF